MSIESEGEKLDLSDDMLIQEIRDGQKDSFDTLMQRHQERVYHIAYSFAKSVENAMDISQNVFLKIYENLGKFRGDSQFKTWMMRITYNESQNWVKKNQKILPHQDIEAVAESSPSSVTHEDEHLISENKTVLLRCLYDLNTKYRLAVILRYYEGFSIKEIAETLKCSQGVVKNMLFRSLQKLKTKLKSIDFGESQ